MGVGGVDSRRIGDVGTTMLNQTSKPADREGARRPR